MKKITDLPALSSAYDLASTDLFIVVEDAVGTPITESMTLTQLASALWPRHAVAGAITPVNDDVFTFGDNSDSNRQKTVTFQNLDTAFWQKVIDLSPITPAPGDYVVLSDVSNSDAHAKASLAQCMIKGYPVLADQAAVTPVTGDIFPFNDISDSNNPKVVTLTDLATAIRNEMTNTGWKFIDPSKYTAIPHDDDEITMSDTSDMFVGAPIKFTYNGDTRRNIIRTVTTDSDIEIDGPNIEFSKEITKLYVGSTEKIGRLQWGFPGIWDTGTGDYLLADTMGMGYIHLGAPIYPIRVSYKTGKADTGTPAIVDMRINGADATRSWDDMNPTTSWQKTDRGIEPNNFTLDDGELLDFYITTQGTNQDAEDLILILEYIKD